MPDDTAPNLLSTINYPEIHEHHQQLHHPSHHRPHPLLHPALPRHFATSIPGQPQKPHQKSEKFELPPHAFALDFSLIPGLKWTEEKDNVRHRIGVAPIPTHLFQDLNTHDSVSSAVGQHLRLTREFSALKSLVANSADDLSMALPTNLQLDHTIPRAYERVVLEVPKFGNLNYAPFNKTVCLFSPTET